MSIWRTRHDQGRTDDGLWTHTGTAWQRATLNEVMHFDLVVWSDGNGGVYDETPLYSPTLYDGHMETCTECDAELDTQATEQGWTLLRGFTGQYSYRGPKMHASEYVGGNLAQHILDNRGFYATVALDDDWVIAYRLNPYSD